MTLTNDEMRRRLFLAVQEIETVRASIPPDVVVEQPWLAWDEKSFDEGMASGNSEIRCEPTMIYTKPLTIKRPIEIFIKDLPHGDRVKPEDKLPWFTRGITIASDACSLGGLKVTDDNLDDIVVCKTGIKHTILSQLLILGDVNQGNKRGIYANTNGSISKCYIDGIKRVGQDTQAIIVTGMAEPGLEIDDCFLSGAGQSFMAGGEDQPAAMKPREIKLTNSDLIKSPQMYDPAPGGLKWQRKCSLELKNVDSFIGKNLVLAGAGIAEGQGGYLMVFTPRNQGGGDPTACVKNVLIQHCSGGDASGVLSLLGRDNNFESGISDNIEVNDFQAMSLDPKGRTGGHARVFFIDKAPNNVRFIGWDITGKNLKAIGYFEGSAPPTGMVLSNIKHPDVTYDWHNPVGITLESLRKYAPDIVISNITVR